MDRQLFRNIQYYGSYQLIYVFFTVILSSIGAFFHFLLDHEISIVESWLHNNHWEILIISKLGSFFLINRWFKIRLYELKSIRQLVVELVKWPQPRAIVVSVFMTVSYLALSKMIYTGQNLAYWYYHLVSFAGLVLYFGIEFVVITHLDDVLNQKIDPSRLWLTLSFTALFAGAFKMSVPDYYGLLPFVIFCFSTLVYLSGNNFKNWSNVVCFLLLFIAPMGSLFGLDPVWGNDFSPFRVEKKLSIAFLAVIWVISFVYYKYREQVILSARKLLR